MRGPVNWESLAGARVRHRLVPLRVVSRNYQDRSYLLTCIWRARFRWRLRPCQVTGDTAYGTVEGIVGLEDQGLRAYAPLADWDGRTPYYGPSRFTYEPAPDQLRCPNGQVLRRRSADYAQAVVRYQAAPVICNACPLKAACTASEHRRQVRRSFYADYLDRVRGYHATLAFVQAMGKRQVWVEPRFGEAKDWHGLERFRLRGLWKVNIEALLIATGPKPKTAAPEAGLGAPPVANWGAGGAFGAPQSAAVATAVPFIHLRIAMTRCSSDHYLDALIP